MSTRKLPFEQETKIEDKITTTTHQPKTTTRTEQQTGGFYNTDGTPNQAAAAEYEQGKKDLANTYYVNPETGQVDRRYLTEILGVDPSIMQKKREEEQQLNRRKQVETGLYKALSVLGDMVTTAGGGNVWKREKDNKSAEYHDRNLALQREQQAEDISNAGKLRSMEQAYANALQNLRKTVSERYGTKVSTSVESGGETESKTIGGNSKTTGYRYGIEHNGGRGGGSRSRSGYGNGSTKVVKIPLKNGRTLDTNVPAGLHDSSGRYLSALYNALSASGEDNIERLLSESGIEPQDTGKDKYTYDGADLLASGIVFDEPRVREEYFKFIDSDPNFTPEEKQQIKNDILFQATKAPKEEKEGLFARIWNKWFGKEEEDASIPPYKRGNDNSSNENIPPYKRGK